MTLLDDLRDDHLGRPQVVTTAGGTVVWQAANAAFDRTVTTDTFGGLNLGFPGQYYDAESGLYYNGFRYYDPTTGRYLQPDPLGLIGGTNPFVYALNDPILIVDSTGSLSEATQGILLSVGITALAFTTYGLGFPIAAIIIESGGQLLDAGLLLTRGTIIFNKIEKQLNHIQKLSTSSEEAPSGRQGETGANRFGLSNEEIDRGGYTGGLAGTDFEAPEICSSYAYTQGNAVVVTVRCR